MTEQKKLKSIDIKLPDVLFETGGDYVLDFSNRTSLEFSNEELGININDPVYDDNGSSKPVNVSNLRSLNAKVKDNVSCSGALFVIDSSFIENGLLAFGKGKSLTSQSSNATLWLDALTRAAV